MSWKWVLRGLKAKEEYTRVDGQKKTSVCPRVKNARQLTAEELQLSYGIKLFQIEGDSVVAFKGADRISEQRPLVTFKEISALDENLEKATEYMCRQLKFSQLTPVQRICIPLGIQGEDFAAIASTGSGKTLAFLLPVVSRILRTSQTSYKGQCKALILSPTRELATQTAQVARNLIEYMSLPMDVADTTVCAQGESATILVCTTGLRYLLKDHPQLLDECEILVMDEVDELLSKSFVLACDKILKKLRKLRKIQIMVFSASLQQKGSTVELLSNVLPHTAPIVRVGTSTMATSSHVEFSLINASSEIGKLSALKQMVEDCQLLPPCLVFVQDKDRAKMLVKWIKENLTRPADKKTIPVGGLHGDMDPAERLENLEQFNKGKLWILVATDIACRGIDFQSVRVVINFDIPTTRESLIHRSGRTGRGTEVGKAVTFYTQQDLPYMRIVTSVMASSNSPVPAELKDSPALNSELLRKNPPLRPAIGHLEGEDSKLFKKKRSILRSRRSQNEPQIVKKRRTF